MTKTVKEFPTEVVNIDDIKPYWRNPRRVGEEAVAAVAASIKEYGYQQPIVVDTERVIIIGHTRYAAMRRLGVTEVPVMVVNLPPARVKELRIIDNRTGEFSSWDFEALMDELESMDSELMTSYFPEVSTDGMDVEPVVTGDRAWDAVVPQVEFVCPSCFHSFEMVVTKETVMTGKLEAAS